jgi:hypothetical protein
LDFTEQHKFFKKASQKVHFSVSRKDPSTLFSIMHSGTTSMALSYTFSHETQTTMPLKIDLLLELESSLGVTAVAEKTTVYPKRSLGDDQYAPNKKRRLWKKTVRFCDDKNTVVYRHLSNEDLKRAWMNQDDYKAIRQENRNTLVALKKVMGKLHILDSEYCIRGLETFISILIFGADRKKNLKIARVVLNEQNIQRASGISDPTTLTAVSMILSRESRIKALQSASFDASP